MKNGWLLLLSAAMVVMVLGGCAYTGMYRYPWYTTARTLHHGEWGFEGSLTPWGFFNTSDGGYSDWPWRPELAARIGLGHHVQVGLSSDFASGLGAEAEYQFHRERPRLVNLPELHGDSGDYCDESHHCIFGPPRLAIGARASWYLNDDVTGPEGVYDLSPRFLVSNERPKTVPYALNLGLDYYGFNGFKAGEGGTRPSGSALSAVVNVGVPLHFRTPVKLGNDFHYVLRVQPAFALNVPLAGSSAGYKASFSESAGLSMEVDAIDYRSGNEGRYRGRP